MLKIKDSAGNVAWTLEDEDNEPQIDEIMEKNNAAIQRIREESELSTGTEREGEG